MHIVKIILATILFGLSGCGGGGGSVTPADNNASETTPIPSDDSSQTDSGIEQCAELLNELPQDTPLTLRNGTSECDYYAERSVWFTSALTIEPGTTIVMAENTEFTVRDGSITAVGTTDEPIRIRGEKRVQGFWSGFEIDDVRSSKLAFVEIFDGGNNSSDESHGLQISGSSIIEIDHVSVSNSFNAGLRLKGHLIDLNSFTHNKFYGNALEGVVTDFQYIESLDATSDFKGDVSPNGVQEIRIADIFNTGGIANVENGNKVSIENVGVPYYFGSISVSGSLSIEPGVSILLSDTASISIYGDLLAEGTTTQGISFSAKDPDGPFESFRLSGSLIASNVQISNGGDGGSSNERVGIISMSHGDSILTLNNVSFQGSDSWGIYCNSFANAVTPENITLNNVDFEDMALGNISIGCGI